MTDNLNHEETARRRRTTLIGGRKNSVCWYNCWLKKSPNDSSQPPRKTTAPSMPSMVLVTLKPVAAGPNSGATTTNNVWRPNKHVVSEQTSVRQRNICLINSHIQNRPQHSPSPPRPNRNIITFKHYQNVSLLPPLLGPTMNLPNERPDNDQPQAVTVINITPDSLKASASLNTNTTTGYEPKRYRWVLILFLAYSLWNMQGSLSLLNPRIVERLKKTKPLTPNRLYPLPFKVNCDSDSFESTTFTTASQISFIGTSSLHNQSNIWYLKTL